VQGGETLAGSYARYANLHVLALLDWRRGSGQFEPLHRSLAMPNPNPIDPSVETCRSLFGEYPEDVIVPIKCAADAISWLEEILRTISQEALDHRNGFRIQRLAEAGAHLASDMGDYAKCQHQNMLNRLRTAGVVFAEGVTA
jgi:hypothetical protein